MGKHEDKLFMKRFSLIIAALMIVTIVIIFIATRYDYNDVREDYQSRHSLISARVQPVGAVRTELPESAAPGEESAAQGGAAEPAGAAETDSSGEAQEAVDAAAVYASVCQACHQTGAAGAPVPGTDAWAERAAKGKETLYESAINGLNAMPAKGGRMDLTDAEVQAAVDHMLEQ